MKIIKLIKLILLKLIIRLDEALIKAKPNQDERNEANKAIFNANRRADRATNVDASDKYKAVAGQAKAKLANRRADRATKADTRRGERKAKQKAKKGKIRQAKYGNKNKSDNKDDNKGRGENKFRLWEISKNYKAVEWGSRARPTFPSTSSLTSLMFQISSTTLQSHPNTSFLCSKFNTLNRHLYYHFYHYLLYYL